MICDLCGQFGLLLHIEDGRWLHRYCLEKLEQLGERLRDRITTEQDRV